MLGDVLEKKLRFFKIPNLMFIIVVVSAFVFAVDHISFLQSGRYFLRGLIYFSKPLILKGQIWRIFTFIFNSLSGNVVFALLEGYFLYFLGTSLEVSLGERKFSLFYVSGVVLAIIAGFLGGTTTSYFLNMSMFFVFAFINPNRKMLLFYFIPVNTMWIAVLDLFYFAVKIIIAIVQKDLGTILTALAAIANFLIFFGPRFFLDIFYNIKKLQERSKRMYRNGNYWGD